MVYFFPEVRFPPKKTTDRALRTTLMLDKQTKGLSLEEINELFDEPVAVHITHDVDANLKTKIEDMSAVGVNYSHDEKV